MRAIGTLLLLQVFSSGQTKPGTSAVMASLTPAPQEAQTRALYEVFLQSVRFREGMPAARAPDGARQEPPLETLRKAAGVEPGAWDLVRQTAGWLHGRLEDNHRQGWALLENARISPGQRRKELDRLWAERQKAIDAAAESLRIAVGPGRFAEFDQRVRALVMPGLRLRWMKTPPWAETERRQ